MATVAQVLKATLQRILVQASESDLEADEYQDAIFALNIFMTDLEASGLNLGYTVVANLSDTVTIPTGALRGLIDNLAILIAPDYGGEVSAALVDSADNGMRTMEHLGIDIANAALPSTLPKGSGNQESGTWTDRYYPDQEADILAATNA